VCLRAAARRLVDGNRCRIDLELREVECQSSPCKPTLKNSALQKMGSEKEVVETIGANEEFQITPNGTSNSHSNFLQFLRALKS
jgi:hypothetical protein